MLRRGIEGSLKKALTDTPVALLVGARQVGKSTLAQALVPEERYLTLDDATLLAAAQADPTAFVARQEGLVVIDEVQRVPDLLLAIKASVDRNRRPGRFLLTGSANIRLVPRVAGALGGRMEILTLWPLSEGEMEKRGEGFLDAVRRARLPGDPPALTAAEVAGRIVRGGYPGGYAWAERRRATWLGSHGTGGPERGARVLKSPKLVFSDTGLATSVLRLSSSRLRQEQIFGPALENFVIMELAKQASWHEEQPTLYHFRTPKGIEVDVVLEFDGGEILGVEVTRSQTLTGGELRGLHELA